MAILGAHAKIEVDAAAALIDYSVEHGAEEVALAWMDEAEPVARRPVQSAAPEAEDLLDLALDTVTFEPVAVFGFPQGSDQIVFGERVSEILTASYRH